MNSKIITKLARGKKWNPRTESLVQSHRCGGISIIDTSGYIPKEQQIALLSAAGRSLDAYYDEMYPDWVEPGTEIPLDPTIQIGYDIFDALDHAEMVRSSLEHVAQAVPENGSQDKETPPPETGGGTSPPPVAE